MLAFHQPQTHIFPQDQRMLADSSQSTHRAAGHYPGQLHPLSASPPLSAPVFIPQSFCPINGSPPSTDGGQFNPPKQVSTGRITPPRSSSPTHLLEILAPNVQKDDGFSISVPKTWTRMDLAPGQTLFICPRVDASQFCENMSVVTEPVQDLKLQDYTSASIFAIGKDVQNRILYSAETSLSGIRAHEVVYSSTHNGVPVIFRQVWLLFSRNGQAKAFVVTFTCEASKYQPLHPITQQMFESFRILRGNQP